MTASQSANSLPVAILAGGLATRLRPITEKIPKSLVEVAGRPFLAHQIELLKSRGLTHVVLCVGYLGEMIREQFGDGMKYGVTLEYSFDAGNSSRGPLALVNPQLLGTGGAVRKALPMLGKKFFVLYGDSYLPIDYQAVAKAFEQSGRPALMTVYANAGKYDTSNVWFENGRIVLYNKKNLRPEMRHIDYGLSAFDASVFESQPENTPFDLAGVLHDLAARNQLAGYAVTRRFYEIGSPAGRAELDALLKNNPEVMKGNT